MPENVEELKNTVLNAPLKNLNQIQQSVICVFLDSPHSYFTYAPIDLEKFI